VPEIIEEGVTGKIVSSEDEALSAIGQVAEFNRYKIRREFERRFSSIAMANSYLKIYRSLVKSANEPGELTKAG
jgi:hypothetical protein